MNYWSRRDVARALNVSVGWIDANRHRLPEPVYVGRLPRWEPEKIIQFVRDGSLAKEAA